MEKWDACSFKVDDESLEGRVCYGGLVLSSTTDITAFVLVFPPLDEDDKFCILPYFWIPEDTLEQKLAYGGHPVLRWMMDNIYIRTNPAGNIKANKEKSTEKIDEAVATIMALDHTFRCGNNTGASVYDERGILFI